jgi:hypothetical protein
MFQDGLDQLLMIAWIDLIQTGSHHGDRATAGFESSAMGRGVDTARQSGDDRDTPLGQLARKHQRRVLAVGRTAARAHDGDTRPFQALCPGTFQVEDHGRIVGFSQQRGINTIVEDQDLTAQTAHFANL